MPKPNNKKTKKQNRVNKPTDKNKNIKQKTEITSPKTSKVLNMITLIGLVILLFYAPYFRGLYFNPEMANTFLYSGLLFLIFISCKIVNKDFKILRSPLDIAAAVLVLAYLLPIIFGQAASAQYSWDKLLRYVNYFFIYLMARDLIIGYKNLTILLNTIVISAVGVSILGIDAGAGAVLTNKLNWFMANFPKWLHIKGGIADLMTFKFFGGFTEGRVYSTLQYPNVLAAYLGAVFILVTGLLVTSNKNWKRFLYGASGFIIFYTFLLTVSRGMFLVLPIMLLVFLAILWKKQLVINTILDISILVLTGAVFSVKYSEFINLGQYSKVWLSILLGILITGTLAVLAKPVKNGLQKVGTKAYLAGIAVIGIVITVFIGFALNIEKPLVIKHEINEPYSEKRVLRDITGIKPDNKYSLEFNIDANTQPKDKSAYKVIIFSIDKFFNLEQLAEISGGAEKAAKKLEFSTKPNTKNIRLFMANYSTGSSAAFSGFKLKNINTGEVRKIIAEYRYLPTDIVYKIKDINLQTHNAWQRLIFVQDAFNVIRDHPLGAGGGGWKALYHKYQSYYYASNEAHNNFVQLWVETGIIGLIALLAVLGLIINHFYKARVRLGKIMQDNIKEIVLLCSIFAAIMSLYAHSAIDFDFSLSAVLILVWTLTGFISAYFIQTKEAPELISEGKNISAMVVLVIVGIGMIAAGFNSIHGRVVLSERTKYGSQIKAEQLKTIGPELRAIYEKYLTLQPLDESTRSDYLMFCNALIRSDPNGIGRECPEIMKRNIDANLNNEPYSYKTLFQAATFYIALGDYEKGVEYAEKAVESARFIGEIYINKAEVYLMAGQSAISKGNIELGRTYVEKAKNIKSEINKASAEAIEPVEMPADIDRVVKEAEDLLAKM